MYCLIVTWPYDQELFRLKG